MKKFEKNIAAPLLSKGRFLLPTLARGEKIESKTAAIGWCINGR
jgi:hypothetical protein